MSRHRRFPLPRTAVLVILVEMAVIALLFLVGAKGLVLAVVPLLVAIAGLALSPSIQDIARPRPKLSVDVNGIASRSRVALDARTLRPWPIAIDRIVANEVAEAEASITPDHSALDTFARSMYPFARRPSERDYEAYREEFRERIGEYGPELRQWLHDYEDKSRSHSELFELDVAVANAVGAAHAESVSFQLDLPDTAHVVDEWPSMPIPPERPRYQPPIGRLVGGIGMFHAVPRRGFDPEALILHPDPLRVPVWRSRNGGRTQEATVGDLHSSRRIRIEETLLVRACGAGTHQLRWHALTKSNKTQATGTIDLIVPSDTRRPPFGRLHGITSYPDVPLEDNRNPDERDDDGFRRDIVLGNVRSNDPPLHPPSWSSDTDDVIETLDRAGAFWEWCALGLDPQHDGADAGVSVRRAGVRDESGKPADNA